MVGKTRLLSCQRGPAASLSWFWRVRWLRSASVAFWEHFTELPLPFLGFSKMGPVLVRGERVYFWFFGSRGPYACGVARDEGVAYALFEGLVEGYVDVVYGAGSEAAVELLAVEAA